jgi:Zn-dependent protease with chaperone function
MSSRRRQKSLLFLLLFAAASCFVPQLLRAQNSDSGNDDSPEDQAPYVDLYIRIAANDSANVTLSAVASHGFAADLMPEVETLLGCKLQQTNTRANDAFMYLGTCRISAAPSGLLRTKTLSLTRITEAARNHGAQAFSLRIELPDSEASETLPRAPLPQVPGANVPARVQKQLTLTSAYAWADLTAVPPAIRVQYGYRQGTVMRTGAILVAILFLPLVVVSWLGRKALAAPREHAPVVWFSYMRYLAWILNFSLIGWLATAETLHASELLYFLISPANANYKWVPVVVDQLFLWCTPVVIWVSCLVLSKPVQEKLRGVSWTYRELALQALYSFSAAFVPLAMIIGALISFSSGAYRAAIFLFVGALVVKLFAKGKLAKLLGMQPHALTSGDLRDVSFAIAGRLGVQLQQIYLIPSGKGRMANAFARTGNTIAFTDYLLNQMTKREVNFVVAHELTHLQKKHPNKIAGISAGIAVGIGTFAGTFRGFFDLPPYLTYGAIIILSTLATYASARRFEYEADAGAVAATNDPEAAICALFKLAQLNLHPLQWSGWSEKWITHPSTMRRAKAIAVRARIPEVSIQSIADRGVEPALHYAVPDDSQRKTKVLSTANKAQNLRWAIFLLLGVALIPPAVAAFAAHKLAGVAPYRYVVYGFGVFVAIALQFYFTNFMSAWRLRPLLERMRERLAANGAVQAESWGGIPVGLAPADRPRVYEGFTHWDLGFLFIRSDRICYVGEEARFSLRHDQITDLRLGPGNPSWFRSQRIYIAWKDESRQASGVFSFAAAHPESAKKLFARTADLFEQLNRWRSAKSAGRPLPEPLAKLETPQLREVTSQPTGALLKGTKLFSELSLTCLLAAMTAALFGLPFHLGMFLTRFLVRGQNPFSGPGAGWYVVAAALSIRLFQIAPLFFYKDRPAITAVPISAGTLQMRTITQPVAAKPGEIAIPVGEKK